MINNRYRDALKGFEKAENGGEIYNRTDWMNHHLLSIIQALKIANKLVQEPSKDMLTRGNIPSSTAYKAMVEQLLNEVE